MENSDPDDVGSWTNPAVNESQEHADKVDQGQYLVARFVSSIARTHQELFSELERVAAVGLLAELAQDFHKPTSRIRRTNITVYLDSPVALDLVGASGSETAAQIRGLTTALQKLGAKISLFDVSVREMSNSIRAILFKSPSERYGPTQEAILRGEIDEAFLSSVVSDPIVAFKPYGVKVQTLGFEGKLRADSYFTEYHYNSLHDELINLHQGRDDYELRCRHDAKAVALVMRLRRGHEHPDLFESSCFFLTRNRLFADIARRFCIRTQLLEDGCVGPFVKTHELAAALWLRTGLSDNEEIPKKQLLAGCARVLALRRPVVVQARRAILRLKNTLSLDPERARQMEAVLSQDRSMLLVSDRIRGGGQAIQEKDLLDIYSRVLQDEEQKGYYKGRADIIKDRDNLAAENSSLIDRLTHDRVRSDEVIASLQTTLDAIQTSLRREQEKKIARLGHLVEEMNNSIAGRRVLLLAILILLALAMFVVSLWREASGLLGFSLRSTRDGHIVYNWPLFISGCLPLSAALLDQCMRVAGHERPVEKVLIEGWAKRRFVQLARERDLLDELSPDLESAVRYERGHIAISFRQPALEKG